MICINCGRPLSDKICDYCGTDYRTDEEKNREKNRVECDHIYDTVFFGDDMRHCCCFLLFKCDRCGEETKIEITRRLRNKLTGGY